MVKVIYIDDYELWDYYKIDYSIYRWPYAYNDEFFQKFQEKLKERALTFLAVARSFLVF